MEPSDRNLWLVLATLLAACSDPAPVPEPGCPTGREDPVPKLAGLERAFEEPDALFSVVVNVRDELPAFDAGACTPIGPFVGCPERDPSLLARFDTHVDRLHCIVDVSGPVEGTPWWYEAPEFLSSGAPVGILLAFSANLTGERLVDVAAHPFVSGVTVAPDILAGGCTAERESAAGKVDGTPSSGEPQFAIVTLRLALREPGCPEGEVSCDAQTRALRTLHVLGTRDRTCVFQHVRDTVGELALLDYGGGGGEITDPTTFYTVAFAVALTPDQAATVAEHPAVERVTLTDLEIPGPIERPMPDLHEGPCPTERESIDGKILDRARLEAATGPQRVMVSVTGGAVVAPFECPDDRGAPCPDRDEQVATWEMQSRISQRCVRALIDEVGGAASGEVLWLVNAFESTLTWEQIAAVAAHPHVRVIEPAETGGPPPP